MSTSVSSVTSHFPDAENGFTTTTSGSVSSGATTVGLNSTSGYTNGEPVVFVIDPTDTTKKQTFTGIIDTGGNQVTSVVWTAGTNVAHSAGATVVDYATATHIAMISKGIKVEHSQDGTHKSAIITSRTEETSTASGDYALISDASDSNNLKKVLLSNLLPTNGVAAAKLATDAITLGYAQLTSNATTTNTSATSISLGVSVTIPAGGRRIKITAFTNGLYNTTAAKRAEMSIWDGTVGSGTQLATTYGPSTGGGLTAGGGIAVAVVTPSAGAKTYNIGLLANDSGTATVEASSTSPAFILVEVN